MSWVIYVVGVVGRGFYGFFSVGSLVREFVVIECMRDAEIL